MTQWVYNFGGEKTDGRAEMKNLLGGKGANLAEMASLGLPVPPGFTVTTDVCTYYYAHDKEYPDALENQVESSLKNIEKAVGALFGDVNNPLLVSVRSGARVSMPGMMDTVLNLGLNDETVKALAKNSGNERFAYDSYRRFIQMYSDVVLGIDHHLFEDVIDSYKRGLDLKEDTQIDADGWQEIIRQYKDVVEDEIGTPFPQDPKAQLWGLLAPYLNLGMSRVHVPTGRSMIFLRNGGRPLMFRPWSLVIWAMIVPRAWLLPATHRRARIFSTVSIW